MYKTNFSFVCSCQLEITYWFEMGAPFPFPLLALGPHLAWIYVGLMHAATVAVNSYVYQLLYLKDTVSLVWAFLQAPTHFLLPLLQSFLSPEARDLMKTSHLGPNVPSSFTLCTSSSCGFCTRTFCKRKILWWWLSKSLSQGCSRILLSHFILLSRTLAFGFTLALTSLGILATQALSGMDPIS